MTAPYPHKAAERSSWIAAQRGPRTTLNPWRPHAFFVEKERMDSGEIVECHPMLVGGSAAHFAKQLAGVLEVAMGLETVHPEILPKLNKQMTLPQFARAAAFLREHEIALRAFILIKPPFLEEAEAVV